VDGDGAGVAARAAGRGPDRGQSMISILSAIFGLAALGMLFLRNRAAFVAGIFILFTMSYRIIDIAYLDLAGPIYAIELGHYVGGGTATPMFVISCLCFILPLWLLCRPAALTAGVAGAVPDLPYYLYIRRAVLIMCGGLIGLAYLDMLRRGTIPLLAGMDRLEYNLMAGPLHGPLYEQAFLVNVLLGVCTTLPRLQGRRFDFRFSALYLALLLYWILTGNRFSIFYTSTCFYMLPFAAVMTMEAAGKLRRMTARDAWSALFSGKVVVVAFGIVASVSLVGLLINSFYEVRNYADPIFQMTQRTFVQPVQLWATTWADVDFARDIWPSNEVFDQVFVNPLNPDSNTSIQYLMSRELGYFRTRELLFHGQQYAGGYPEIFFDLFGAWFALPIFTLLGIVTALMLRIVIASLVRGKVFTGILAIYVYFGFTLTYIGGMLNFLLAPTFAAKVVLLVVAAIWEDSLVNGPAGRPREALRIRP
jgi:Family of unknown function (DUF6418)